MIATSNKAFGVRQKVLACPGWSFINKKINMIIMKITTKLQQQCLDKKTCLVRLVGQSFSFSLVHRHQHVELLLEVVEEDHQSLADVLEVSVQLQVLLEVRDHVRRPVRHLLRLLVELFGLENPDKTLSLSTDTRNK